MSVAAPLQRVPAPVLRTARFGAPDADPTDVAKGGLCDDSTGAAVAGS